MSGKRAPSPPRTTGFPENTSALKEAFRAGRPVSEPVIGPEGFDPGAGTPVGHESGGKHVEGKGTVLDVLKVRCGTLPLGAFHSVTNSLYWMYSRCGSGPFLLGPLTQ